MKTTVDFSALALDIKKWGSELGFDEIRISDINLEQHEAYLQGWLEQGFHGEMQYMADHGNKRSRPDKLIPGTIRIISARMNYLYSDAEAKDLLQSEEKAYISRYALGRDYHKVIRGRLKKLANKIKQRIGEYSCHNSTDLRAFVDSAPVLEKALAEKAGLGWIGKHTLLINREVGSWFFLGEIYTNLPLPIDHETTAHCGTCTACIDICPTKAIVGPYKLDARRCISYLTIELKTAIPVELRPLMGNRIFGCDDCQLFCPWNRYAKFSPEDDYKPRHQLDDQNLIDLFNWDEETFLEKTEGSPIRRTGYQNWIRNIAVALGNAQASTTIQSALKKKLHETNLSDMIKEHIQWALSEQKNKSSNG